MSALMGTGERRFVVMKWLGGYRLYDLLEECFTGKVYEQHRYAVFAARRYDKASKEEAA